MLSPQSWRQVHSWSSLACTAFLLLACTTGLPLIFHDELDKAFRGEPARTGDPTRPQRSLDDLIERGRQHEQGQYVQFVFWDDEAPELVGLGMASTPNASLEEVHRLMLDAGTGDVAETRPPENRGLRFLLDLHSSLLAAQAGELILGIVALCLLVSVVSGAVLYGPTMRRIDFGVVRTWRSRRVMSLDLHNLIGIAVTMWLVVVGVTGFINTLEGRLFGTWQGDQIERLLAPYKGKPYPSALSSPQAAVNTAMAALPGMTPTSEGFPYSRFGSPRHYLIWMHGVTPVTAHLFTPVLVDAGTGQLAAAEGLPWYLRVLELSRPLHFGDYGRLPLKLLWAALDLLTMAITVTGLALWWNRHGAGRPSREAGQIAS